MPNLRQIVDQQTLAYQLLVGVRHGRRPLTRDVERLIRSAGYGRELDRVIRRQERLNAAALDAREELDAEVLLSDVQLKPSMSAAQFFERLIRETPEEQFPPEDIFFKNVWTAFVREERGLLAYRARIEMSRRYNVDMNNTEELMFRWARERFRQIESIRFFTQFTGH